MYSRYATILPIMGTSGVLAPVHFLREVREELKLVVWPGREKIVRLTAIVIVVSLAVGLFVGTLDFLFTNSLNFILKR